MWPQVWFDVEYLVLGHVGINGEYQSAMYKINHYLWHEHKVKENNVL